MGTLSAIQICAFVALGLFAVGVFAMYRHFYMQIDEYVVTRLTAATQRQKTRLERIKVVGSAAAQEAAAQHHRNATRYQMAAIAVRSKRVEQALEGEECEVSKARTAARIETVNATDYNEPVRRNRSVITAFITLLMRLVTIAAIAVVVLTILYAPFRLDQVNTQVHVTKTPVQVCRIFAAPGHSAHRQLNINTTDGQFTLAPGVYDGRGVTSPDTSKSPIRVGWWYRITYHGQYTIEGTRWTTSMVPVRAGHCA